MAITTTQLTTANALAVMVQQRIIADAERSSVIFPRFASVNSANVPGITLGIRQWGDFSDDVENPAEGAAFTDIDAGAGNNVFSTTQLTPAITGLALQVTDLLESAWDAGSLSQAISTLFRSIMIEEVDDDLAALFATLNGGTKFGGAGAALTLSGLIDGLVEMQTNQAVGPYFFILHPKQAAEVGLEVMGFSAGTDVTSAQGTATQQIGDRIGGIGSAGLVGSVMGVPTWVSPRVTNAAANHDGCVAAPDALTTVFKWMVRTEVQREAMEVAQNIVVSSAYAVGETVDTWGASITSAV